jgi:predicted O-methyltransferase YrrM
MPPNDRDAAATLLATLQRHGLTRNSVLHDAEFEDFRRRIRSEFMHLSDRYTAIFPEEARAAFELSLAVRPRRVVVAGSYYGYLAVWLVPGLADGGRMVCIDPDTEVSDLADRNMRTLGYADRVSVLADDAVRVLGDDEEPVDLLVVDAHGGRSNPNPRYHGKAIYGPIVEAALPRMTSGAFVLAHNADRSSAALSEFYDRLAGARFSVFLDTTENLAVFAL